ncbi:MAG: hypothetical protein A3E01_02635 [Gammaproteobacteria bacterium RIFCSPHIGHO2_12_FULL_63_22]|nr:MAG: hypothetical protein A3E01_02635 [Gammaproteobacteria bacterium RIFCSPHIGHO2_12_FULL_63_22]
MSDKIDWDAVQAACDAATKTPWYLDEIDNIGNELTVDLSRVSYSGDVVIDTLQHHDAVFVHLARTALPAALAERTRLRELLRSLEWSGIYSYCTGWPCCPVCKGIKPGVGEDNPPTYQRHHVNCRLKEALRDD